MFSLHNNESKETWRDGYIGCAQRALHQIPIEIRIGYNRLTKISVCIQTHEYRILNQLNMSTGSTDMDIVSKILAFGGHLCFIQMRQMSNYIIYKLKLLCVSKHMNVSF